MALTINSRTGLSGLAQSNRALADSLERLSSGKKINKAADDASSMIIANTLGSQISGIGQSIRNANDAVSITQVADGAIGQAGDLVMNIRNLAMQAASGAQTADSRQALQSEINRSLATLDQISQNTSFNGQNLLGGDFTDKTFQTGLNAGETVTISIPAMATDQLGDNSGSLSSINVLTEEGAQAAIGITDQALSQIDNARSQLGSTQNQLQSSIASLSTTRVNLSAAQSQINDVDIAEESMVLSQMKVLTQAKAFATTQAGKLNEKNIINLLQG